MYTVVIVQGSDSLPHSYMFNRRLYLAAMFLPELIFPLVLCTFTAGLVIPQNITEQVPLDAYFGNETNDVSLNPTEVPVKNASIWPSEASLSFIYNDTLNTPTMGDNSTTSNSTVNEEQSVPEAALLIDQEEMMTTGNATTVPIAQQLQLTDMSKVKSFVEDANGKLDLAIPQVEATTPFMVTPIPEETTTISETEVLLRKLANEILMKLFDKFVLKAAALNTRTETLAEPSTVRRVLSPSPVEVLTSGRRPSALRRRLIYGGRSEYEGWEESGFYRPEIEREGFINRSF